jgi:hypothetical protein
VIYRLQNRSDLPKTVSWNMVSQSGGGISISKPVEIRPGEVKEVRFDWAPSIPGDALLKLSVDEGAKTHHELQWRLRVNTSTSSSVPMGVTVPVEVPVSPAIAEEKKEEPVFSAATPVEAKPIPEIEQLGYRLKNPWFVKPTLHLNWKGGSSSLSRITLEEMVLVQVGSAETEKGTAGPSDIPAVKLESVPINEFKRITKGELETVLIPQPSSGWHLLSISLYQPDSSVPVACSQIQVKIPPKKSWWALWRMPLGIILVLLLLLFLRAYRARSGA